MELYILGVLVALAILVVMTYFDDDDITVRTLVFCVSVSALSWIGVFLLIIYFLFEVVPTFLQNKGIWNKVVWKRKK